MSPLSAEMLEKCRRIEELLDVEPGFLVRETMSDVLDELYDPNGAALHDMAENAIEYESPEGKKATMARIKVFVAERKREARASRPQPNPPPRPAVRRFRRKHWPAAKACAAPSAAGRPAGQAPA